jgi:hypothetical protein
VDAAAGAVAVGLFDQGVARTVTERTSKRVRGRPGEGLAAVSALSIMGHREGQARAAPPGDGGAQVRFQQHLAIAVHSRRRAVVDRGDGRHVTGTGFAARRDMNLGPSQVPDAFPARRSPRRPDAACADVVRPGATGWRAGRRLPPRAEPPEPGWRGSRTT